MKNSALSRRAMLKGAGGACLALPLLDIMGGCNADLASKPQQFRGSGGVPKRFVVFWTPNGTIMQHWRPSGSESSFTLPRILQPLDPHKQDIVVLDGVDEMSAYKGPGDAHQKGTGQSLTATELQEGDFPGDGGKSAGWADGISVDQAIADVVGDQTKFRSLEFGVYVYGANVGSRISYRGPAQPIPPENDPTAAFNRIFADLESDPEAQMRRIAERKIVLDAVAADYQRLVKKVGAADRIKLEAHLAAVRDIEMRLETGGTIGGACEPPMLGEVADPLKVANIPKTGKLQMDLLAMALACDLTRVASIMWTNSATAKPFPWLNIPEGHHELAHRGDGDLDAQEKLTVINTWYCEQFAYLIEKLKSIPEGDGTVLDNTLLIWVNEHQKGNDHDRHEIPYVVAGKAGGAVKTGRWLQVPGERAHNDLWSGCMNVMGIEAKTFGNPIYCQSPLALG
ncbi:DUF1552 domain-containing protein [Nannocystis radixulma]|uniref:DUF1552 domain-containing protein n=1 Tax=Nannocystis radixulma TaxID=2995305 RepID=A0ABT5BF95_9BACT|nr:DUF1552 domain-containing protein [Nannocystis radixulma]MDC0672827.1 DUF1552 domain-containing protein [Nannocystis radixulma]